MKYLSMLTACLVLIGFTKSGAQVYPDTLWVPVTYYDFHSNGSSPDFQTPSVNGVVSGMVQQTLDADTLPQAGSVCPA